MTKYRDTPRSELAYILREIASIALAVITIGVAAGLAHEFISYMAGGIGAWLPAWRKALNSLVYGGFAFGGLLYLYGLYWAFTGGIRRAVDAAVVAVAVAAILMFAFDRPAPLLQGPEIPSWAAWADRMVAVTAGALAWVTAYFSSKRVSDSDWLCTTVLVPFGLAGFVVWVGSVFVLRILEGDPIGLLGIVRSFFSVSNAAVAVVLSLAVARTALSLRAGSFVVWGLAMAWMVGWAAANAIMFKHQWGISLGTSASYASQIATPLFVSILSSALVAKMHDIDGWDPD